MIEQFIRQSGLPCRGGFIAYYNDMSLYAPDPMWMLSRAVVVLIGAGGHLFISRADLTRADRAVREVRNRTENRLRNKASKRDLEASAARLRREDGFRLESREGEIPFENYLRIDNTDLPAAEAAARIRDFFRLPGKTGPEARDRQTKG